MLLNVVPEALLFVLPQLRSSAKEPSSKAVLLYTGSGNLSLAVSTPAR